MVPAFIHTHACTEYVKRADALDTPRVYRGRILHLCSSVHLNKWAYARGEMYAQLPGVKPTDVPD